MKISFLLLSIDQLGGTEQAAVTQASALAGRHEVEIISTLRLNEQPRLDVDPRVRIRYLTSVGGHAPDDGVETPVPRAEELASRPSTLVPDRWDPTLNALCDVALTEHLPRLKTDVLVTMTTGLLAAAVQLLPARVAHVHQEHRSSMHRTAGREPLLSFAPRTDAVVSLTEVNAVWLREQLGSLAPTIHVVPNMAPGPGQPRSLLDQPIIMAAGRLTPEKRYHDLVAAFGLIADQIPDWRLRIFGAGPQRNRLLATARRSHLYDRVELPGATADLAAEWAKASVSALTSTRECLPLVVMESMAAGVPVVAYDCPTGPAELIEHGGNGFLVAEGDVETLGSRLLELAQDRDQRIRMGGAAVDSLHRFDPDTIRDRWEQIYTEVRASRGRGPAPWVTRQSTAGVSTPTEASPEPAAGCPLLTPAESRRALFGEVADALRDVSGWFALPQLAEFPPTFVVPTAQLPETLDALEKASFPEHVSLALTEDDHWNAGRDTVARAVRTLRHAMPKGLRIEPWPEHGGHLSHLSERAGIAIEFWPERSGELTALRPNPFTPRLNRDRLSVGEVEGTTVPTITDTTGPFLEECQFPIDVVYTWVDDSDPDWQRARAARLGESEADLQDRAASGAARFRNRDELRYSMRSIEAYAPWVRTIHVVTAGQRPAWLRDHPKVRIVDHRDLLPTDALPTFNSHAIETALHRIPGLADHFIYFNDDVLLGRPLDPRRFFTPGGDIAVFFSDTTIGTPGSTLMPWQVAALNNRRLLSERFGAIPTRSLAHTPHPLRKDLLARVSEEFPDALERTARAPFRSPTDVSLTSSLVQHYALRTGEAFSSALNTRFIDTSGSAARFALLQAMDRKSEAICVADHHDYALSEDQIETLLTDFFGTYYPVPAPWESTDRTDP